MIFEQYTPPPPLGLFVESFVYYKGYQPDYTMDRFLPDGHSHVVFDLTEVPKYIYHNETLKEIQSCRRVWFSGIREELITIPSGKDSEMMIINFRFGKAYPFAEMPMDELADSVVDGEIVMSSDILDIREGLMYCLSPKEKFLYVESKLLSLFGERLTVNPFTDFAVTYLAKNPNNAAIASLSHKVGFSQKHLISLFKNHVGLSPKAFMKIMRFQHVINTLDHREDLSMTHVALNSGYYDQAHFIHDFRKFSGYTPAAYLETRREFTNYIAVD